MVAVDLLVVFTSEVASKHKIEVKLWYIAYQLRWANPWLWYLKVVKQIVMWDVTMSGFNVLSLWDSINIAGLFSLTHTVMSPDAT